MEIGTQTGPFRVESLLGRGGMAEVFKVWHQDLERHEAMKVLPPALTYDRSFVERFLREARTAAGMQHPNIASIYAVSEANAPQPYFTMELIGGGDLADLIEARGHFSLDDALPILRQIAHALDYAGGRGLIHRDIKPANIMLNENGEGVKVVDFGIARAQEEANGTRMTQTGMIVGTPEYMSPEQAGSGAPVGARTDQYSLGIIAYEMLCGEPPFRAHSDTGMMSVLMGHVRDAPRPPIERVPGLSANANNALLKSLAKNPADRFASCGEFVRALEGEVRVAAPPLVAQQQQAAPKIGAKKGNPWPAVAIGAVLFGGVAALALGMRGRDDIVEVAPTDVQNASALVAQNGGASAAVEPTAVETVTVPDLVSMKEAQAREFLQSKSLRADITTGQSDEVNASLVASQFPVAGAQVARNSAVRVKISTGPGASGAAVEVAENEGDRNEGETDASSSPTSADMAQVGANYEAWQAAWRQMDLDSFMSFYSRDVVQMRAGKRAHGYSTQRSRLATAWSKVSYVNLSSGSPRISTVGQNIVLSAYQNYEDSNYWDKGTKRQVWTREGGEWKIIEESFSKSAGGKR